MRDNYEEYSKVLKAIADANRLKIIDILSCGERCACDIQQYFNFTQPTLSHHMKILMESGLVVSRKEGTWMRYSLDLQRTNQMMYFIMGIVTPTKGCICESCGLECSKKEEI
ncbi:metalloregulator ArsR/SmtB family transcription factor [Lachnoclostridium sp.]|uniref:ArsR/SmtB family transcription factor n=1 Tax=Lachnoclostridium sp. TaxID=2028282 RepID=UPI00289E0B0F|nr:metalloregulator ArsR/SmtB family transcription factor [Lachnoclostridium sp.]